MRTLALTPLVFLAACGWNHLPDQSSTFLGTLWNPDDVVPTEDGLYVPLPRAGGMALVAPNEDPVLVDIGEGRLTTVAPSPDGQRVIGVVERYSCDVEDPRDEKSTRIVEDCRSDDLVVHTEIGVVSGGEIEQSVEIEGQTNTVVFSEDGRYAVAYLDLSKSIEVSGVIDLTSVLILDLDSGEAFPTQVGFNANNVLFVYDDSGAAKSLVVLSQSSVGLVDLTGDRPELDVNYALTLDPDQVVNPVGIDLTPDGQYALISVAGKSELYALDLVDPSVRIVELSAPPSDMTVDASSDTTVLVSRNSASVDVIDHEFLDLESYDLDESMSRIEQGDAFSILWSDRNNRDVYWLDLMERELVEYRLQSAPVSVHLAPTEDFAIALTRAGGATGLPGMEILDLVEEKSRQFALEGVGIDVAWSATETDLHALVLQEGQDYLYKYALYTGDRTEIELEEPPASVGTLPDGRFYVTHFTGTGLVSFVNPNDDSVTEVAGFASLGIADDIELTDLEEEE